MTDYRNVSKHGFFLTMISFSTQEVGPHDLREPKRGGREVDLRRARASAVSDDVRRVFV